MGQSGPQRKLKDVQKMPAILWIQQKGGQAFIDKNRTSLQDLVDLLSKDLGKGIYTVANVKNILSMMGLTPRGRTANTGEGKKSTKSEVLRRLQRIEDFLKNGLGFTTEDQNPQIQGQ